jgi:pimeloyl-ACP methyl ester carboxylesterase
VPLPFLLGWLAGLSSFAILGGGLWILWAWYVGELVGLAWIVTGSAMLLWSAAGRHLVLAFYPRGTDEPEVRRSTGGHEIAGPDGSRLHMDEQGASSGKPALVLTHGWALDSEAWYYARRQLGEQYRLILWDLPGLGRSTQPADGRYTVERLAEDLLAVIEASGERRVTLVGHSIGGMMMLTLCRLHPDIGRRVNGLVFVDTTYTYPLNTTMGGKLLRALRRPLIEPLLYLTVWLWPLVWLMNWQSYFNGTSHIVNRITSFSRHVSRGQLDAGAWYSAKDHPGVLAKGLLAVLRWTEEGTLPEIQLPARVITGDADRLTRPEAAQQMTARIPTCDLVTIRGAGHNGLLEEGRDYARAIDNAARRFAMA